MRRRFRPSIGRSTPENKGDTNNATTSSDTVTGSPLGPPTRRARIKPKVGIVGSNRTGCPVQRRPQIKPSNEVRISEPVIPSIVVPSVQEKYGSCLASGATNLQDPCNVSDGTIGLQSTENQLPEKNTNLQDKQHVSATDLENIQSNQFSQEKGRSEDEPYTISTTGLQDLQDVTSQNNLNLQDEPHVSRTELQNIRSNPAPQKNVNLQNDIPHAGTTELQNNASEKSLNLQDESQITTELSDIGTETILQRNLDSQGEHHTDTCTNSKEILGPEGQSSLELQALVVADAGLTSDAADTGYLLDNIVHLCEGNDNVCSIPYDKAVQDVEPAPPVLINEDSILLQSRTEPESLSTKSTFNVVEEHTQESTKRITEIVAESRLSNSNLDFNQLHNADDLLKNLLGSECSISQTVSNLNNTSVIEVITDLQPSTSTSSECTVLPVVNREECITSDRSGPTTTMATSMGHSQLNTKRRRARPRVRLPRPQAGRRQPDFSTRRELDSSEIPIASNVVIDLETSNPETQVIDHPVLELPIDLIQDDTTQDCVKEKKTMRSLKRRFRQRSSGTVKVVVSRHSSGKDDSSTQENVCEGTGTSEDIEENSSKRQEIVKKRKVGPNVMQLRRNRSQRNQQEPILIQSDVSDNNVEKVSSECSSAENQENIVEVLASSEDHEVGRQDSISVLPNDLEVQNEDSANAITDNLEVENLDSINVIPTLSDSHDIENQISIIPASSNNLCVTHQDIVTTVFTPSNNLEDISLSIPDNTMDDILQDISEPLSAAAECPECPEILTSITTSVSDDAQAPEQRSSNNDLVPGTLENFLVMVSTQSNQATTNSVAPVSTITTIGDNSTESTMTMWQQKGKKLVGRRRKATRGKLVDDDLGSEVTQSVDKEVGSQDIGDPKGTEGTQGVNEEPVSQDPKGSKGSQKGKKVVKRKRKVRGKVVDDDEGQEGTESLNKGSESQGTVEPDGSSGAQGVNEASTSEGHQGIPGDQITQEVTGGKKRRGRPVKPKVPAKRGRKKAASKEPAQVSEENGEGTVSTSVADGGETSGLPAENGEENSTSQKTKKKRRTPAPKKSKDSSKQKVSSTEGEPVAKKSKQQEKAEKTNSMVNISSMRISDMVHYNPKTNPMKSSNKDETQDSILSGLSTQNNESEIILPAVDQDETSVDGGTQQSSVLAPRVTIDAEGNIVLDEESLVIQSTGSTEDAQNRELVFENANQQYKSSQKKLRMDKWNKEETLYFYEVLSQIGTDFSLMSKLFPKRSRTELKKKFKREEKANQDLIEKALSQRNPIPASLFAEYFEETEEEMERALVVSPEETSVQA